MPNSLVQVDDEPTLSIDKFISDGKTEILLPQEWKAQIGKNYLTNSR